LHISSLHLLRLAIVPERLLGRVNASFGFLITGAGLLGALLGGALAVAALGISPACLWIIGSPLWRVRATPAQPETLGPDMRI
jgi:hypothetical protein